MIYLIVSFGRFQQITIDILYRWRSKDILRRYERVFNNNYNATKVKLELFWVLKFGVEILVKVYPLGFHGNVYLTYFKISKEFKI